MTPLPLVLSEVENGLIWHQKVQSQSHDRPG